MPDIFVWPDEYGPSATKGSPTNTVSANPVRNAVLSALDGDTLNFNAGVYPETSGLIEIHNNRVLRFIGPNAGMDPNVGSRGPEADLRSCGFRYRNTASFDATGVIFDGLKFSTQFSNARLHVQDLPSISGGDMRGTMIVQNCIFDDASSGTGAGWTTIFTEGKTTSAVDPFLLVVRNNLFNGLSEGYAVADFMAADSDSRMQIEDNVFTDCIAPMNISAGRNGMYVRGNIFTRVGAYCVLVAQGTTDISIDHNVFNDCATALYTNSWTTDPVDGVKFLNNTINLDIGTLDRTTAQVQLVACKNIQILDNDFNFTGTLGSHPLGAYTFSAESAHAVRILSTWEVTLHDIRRNTFDGGNTVSAPTTEPKIAFLYLRTLDPTYGPLPSVGTVRCNQNSFVDAEAGIVVYDTVNDVYGGLPATFTADMRNNTYENCDWGVHSGTGGITDGRSSFWGSPTGPSGDVPDPVVPGVFANGSGSEVSVQVRFTPKAEGVCYGKFATTAGNATATGRRTWSEDRTNCNHWAQTDGTPVRKGRDSWRRGM